MHLKLLKRKLYEEIINDFNKNKAVYMFYLSPIIFKLKTKDFKNYKYSLFSKIKNKELAEFKTYKLKKYLKKDYEKDLKTIIKIIFKSDYIDENNKYALHYIKKLVKKPSKLCYINLIYRLLTDINKKTGGMMGISLFSKKKDEKKDEIKEFAKVKSAVSFLDELEQKKMQNNIKIINNEYSNTKFYNIEFKTNPIKTYISKFFGTKKFDELIIFYNNIIILYNYNVIKKILNDDYKRIITYYEPEFNKYSNFILHTQQFSDINEYNTLYITNYNIIISIYNRHFNTKKTFMNINDEIQYTNNEENNKFIELLSNDKENVTINETINELKKHTNFNIYLEYNILNTDFKDLCKDIKSNYNKIVNMYNFYLLDYYLKKIYNTLEFYENTYTIQEIYDDFKIIQIEYKNCYMTIKEYKIGINNDSITDDNINIYNEKIQILNQNINIYINGFNDIEYYDKLQDEQTKQKIAFLQLKVIVPNMFESEKNKIIFNLKKINNEYTHRKSNFYMYIVENKEYKAIIESLFGIIKQKKHAPDNTDLLIQCYNQITVIYNDYLTELYASTESGNSKILFLNKYKEIDTYKKDILKKTGIDQYNDDIIYKYNNIISQYNVALELNSETFIDVNSTAISYSNIENNKFIELLENVPTNIEIKINKIKHNKNFNNYLLYYILKDNFRKLIRYPLKNYNSIYNLYNHYLLDYYSKNINENINENLKYNKEMFGKLNDTNVTNSYVNKYVTNICYLYDLYRKYNDNMNIITKYNTHNESIIFENIKSYNESIKNLNEIDYNTVYNSEQNFEFTLAPSLNIMKDFKQLNPEIYPNLKDEDIASNDESLKKVHEKMKQEISNLNTEFITFDQNENIDKQAYINYILNPNTLNTIIIHYYNYIIMLYNNYLIIQSKSYNIIFDILNSTFDEIHKLEQITPKNKSDINIHIDFYNNFIKYYNKIIITKGGNGQLNNYKLQFLLASIYKKIKLLS